MMVGFMVKDNKILREWDEASESWSNFVQDGKDYYREELNNPATFRLIGNVKGKHVLDLACGEGYNTRILAKKGALVVGVDFSERMIELARKEEKKERQNINYYVSDAADMRWLSSNYFDLVACFMSLQDIEPYEDAISEVARVLKKNGRFIFSIPHPCFEQASLDDGECISGWKYEEGTENTSEKKALHMEIKRYFGIIKYKVSWNMERLVEPFKTTGFHRTLTDYSQTLYENGLLILRLVEPRPTSRAVSKHPSLRKVTKIPQSIIIEAIKR